MQEWTEAYPNTRRYFHINYDADAKKWKLTVNYTKKNNKQFYVCTFAKYDKSMYKRIMYIALNTFPQEDKANAGGFHSTCLAAIRRRLRANNFELLPISNKRSKP